MKRRKLTARTALTFIWIIFNLQVFCYAGFVSSGNTKYYVDSIDGNDSAYGTSPQEAWRTLTKVNDTTFAAGDQILFRAGCFWDGQLLLKGSGTASNPISVNIYSTGNKPIINAGGTTANDAAAVRLKNQQYWEINNLEITHTNGSTGYQGGLWAIRVIVDNGTEINHIYIRDCYIHHVNGDVATKKTGGIYVTADGTNPAWYNDLKIQNNTIANTGGLGIATQSPHGKFSAPVRYPYLNVLISGNTVGPTGRNNMIIRVSDDAIVEHNRFIDSSIHDKGHSVFCFNTDNVMIQYNEAYGNVGPASQTDRGGFDADYNCKNTKIQYNYSHDNNWFCGIMKTGFNENVVIRYNISQNDKEAIYLYGFETATGPQGCQVYNNTHYIASTVTGVEVFRDRTARNTDFYNNIFHFEGSGSWGTGNPVNCTFENNCYYNISPKGTNFITANPQLMSPGSGGYDINWADYPNVLTGYQLQSSSPCINTGRIVANNGGQDFWGNALYNGAPDIGAHEYSPGVAISGHILEPNTAPIEGVLVSATGGGSDVTGPAGYYELDVSSGWSGTVTPTKLEYIFDPNSRTYTDVTENQINQDYTGTFVPDLMLHAPDPMTWAVVPYQTGDTSISIAATMATDDNSVVTINDMPVSEAEYKLHLSSSIAIIYNYFHHKYGAEDHDDFWTTSYEGEVPLECVKAKTNEKLTHIKVLQKLAIEEGLIYDFHYDDFLVQWDEYNRKRTATHEAGGIIYGPITSSIRNYYDYLFSNLVIKLKRKLNQTRFAASDSTLKSYYKTIKGEYFRYTPSIEVAYLEFPYESSSQKEIALREAHAAQERVLQGAALESLTGEFSLAHYGRVTYPDTALMDGEENPDRVRRKLALQLNTGDIKVLHTQESMNSGIYLMQCLGRSPERTLAFSTVKQDVLWYYQEAKYSELVDSLKKNAVVRFNQPVYQSIKIR